MKYWRQTIGIFSLTLPSRDVQIAMDYLEENGQQFCFHFGITNALYKAVDLYIGKLEISRGWE